MHTSFQALAFATFAASTLSMQAAANAASAPPPESPAGGATHSSSPPSPTTTRAEAGYRLGPDDVVEVFVWKEPELSSTATVRPDGRISMPLVGEIQAAGKTPEQLQVEIARGLGDYVTAPVVTVIVKEVNSSQVAVLGEVRRPGRYRIGPGATILDGIALGGGFTEFARRSRVVVLRATGNGVVRIPINVDKLLRRGEVPLALRAGDTIHVD